MNTERISLRERARIHAALGDPARLAIVDALSLGDASPGEIAHDLNMATNLVAHHVKVLAEAGLLERTRSEADRRRTYLRLRVRGKTVPVWYAVDDTGAVSAAELDAAPPGRRIVADGAGGYRPRPADGADLTVRFTGDTLQTISSQGRTEARAAD